MNRTIILINKLMKNKVLYIRLSIILGAINRLASL